MSKRGYVYFLMNKTNTVIYVGVTSDLKKRVFEHKNKFVDGFTKRYKADKLVYYEIFDSLVNAIAREKQIKGGSRKAKEALIVNFNARYEDLYLKI